MISALAICFFLFKEYTCCADRWPLSPGHQGPEAQRQNITASSTVCFGVCVQVSHGAIDTDYGKPFMAQRFN